LAGAQAGGKKKWGGHVQHQKQNPGDIFSSVNIEKENKRGRWFEKGFLFLFKTSISGRPPMFWGFFFFIQGGDWVVFFSVCFFGGGAGPFKKKTNPDSGFCENVKKLWGGPQGG